MDVDQRVKEKAGKKILCLWNDLKLPSVRGYAGREERILVAHVTGITCDLLSASLRGIGLFMFSVHDTGGLGNFVVSPRAFMPSNNPTEHRPAARRRAERPRQTEPPGSTSSLSNSSSIPSS